MVVAVEIVNGQGCVRRGPGDADGQTVVEDQCCRSSGDRAQVVVAVVIVLKEGTLVMMEMEIGVAGSSEVV